MRIDTPPTSIMLNPTAKEILGRGTFFRQTPRVIAKPGHGGQAPKDE